MRRRKFFLLSLLWLVVFSSRSFSQSKIHEVASLENGAALSWSGFYRDEKFLISRANGDVERWSVEPLRKEAVLINRFEFAKRNIAEQHSLHFHHDSDAGFVLLFYYEMGKNPKTKYFLFSPEFWETKNRPAPQASWSVDGQADCQFLPGMGMLMITKSGGGRRSEVEIRDLSYPNKRSRSFKLGGQYRGCWVSDEGELTFATLANQFASDYTISRYDLKRNRVVTLRKWNLPSGIQIAHTLPQVGLAAVADSTLKSNVYAGTFFASINGPMRRVSNLRPLFLMHANLNLNLNATKRLLLGSGVWQHGKIDAIPEFEIIDVATGKSAGRWKGIPKEHPVALSVSGRYVLTWCESRNEQKNGWLLRHVD